MDTAKNREGRQCIDLVRQEAARWFGIKKSGDPPSGLERWIPAVHILETDRKIAVRTELPGMKRDEVKVSVKDELLSITCDRKPKRLGDRRSGERTDLDCDTFFLCFNLPPCLNRKRVRSRFAKGVLEISLTPIQPGNPRPSRDTKSRTSPAPRNHTPAPRSRPSR